MKATQNMRIMEYLTENGSITPLEAMQQLGVMRLAARIEELKRDGAPIVMIRETVRNRWGESTNYARYWLVR